MLPTFDCVPMYRYLVRKKNGKFMQECRILYCISEVHNNLNHIKNIQTVKRNESNERQLLLSVSCTRNLQTFSLFSSRSFYIGYNFLQQCSIRYTYLYLYIIYEIKNEKRKEKRIVQQTYGALYIVHCTYTFCILMYPWYRTKTCTFCDLCRKRLKPHFKSLLSNRSFR